MWTTTPTSRTPRRALLLLALGGTLGLLLGVVAGWRSAVSPPSHELPGDVIATVNGKAIHADEFANTIALLAGDTREALTEADREHALQRMIEEELLVQQGIARGIVATDHAVRQAIVTAMLDAIIAESASERPSPEALLKFSEQQRVELQNSAPGGDAEGTFATQREQLEALYLQMQKDEALREYLDWLRSEAKVLVAEESGG